MFLMAYDPQRLIGAAHVPRSTFRQETQHVRGQETHKRSHTAVFSEGWGVTLGEKHYSDLPHSLQLKFIPSVLFLRYVTPPLPPTSPLQLSMEGTPTQSHERIHIITCWNLWKHPHGTLNTTHNLKSALPFSLWGVLPLPLSILHLFNQISDLSAEVLHRGAGQ